ncbi:MAG: HD-GYP domain-containing protein [Actinobacteria bacterium]|nr:HD-GYP domain-containing protein [Actinomycetota bacterium]
MDADDACNQERCELKDGTNIPGGYMLHSPTARTSAARLAIVHCAVMGIVVAICAVRLGRMDMWVFLSLIGLCIWSPLIAVIPWARYSHNWLAKIYFLGAAWFIFYAIRFDNPYLLLGIWPEMVVFADAYWYRKSLMSLHLAGLAIAFVGAAVWIDGAELSAITLVALPLMLLSAITAGAISHRFIQTLMQRRQFQSAVTSLLEALHARDGYTGDHSMETLAMAMAVADQLKLGETECKLLADTALLHDIGKIGIPNSILQKPGALTEEEWVKMREHPVIGEQILGEIPGFEQIAKAVRHEHERWDGSGYPDGISGEQIPLASRIVLVCDAFHAMTSDRPYRKAMPHDDARSELSRHAGSQFDPVVVAAFDSAIEQGIVGFNVDEEEGPQQAQPDHGMSDARTDINRALPIDDAPAEPESRVSIDDPVVVITVNGVTWSLIAIVMSAYLIARPPFDLFGAAFVSMAAMIATGSFFLRRFGAPRLWSLCTGLFAYVAATAAAMHYDQPAMLMFALGPAITTSTFFWQHTLVKVLQSVLVMLEFVVFPVALFGMSLLPMAVTGVRAFPGVLLVVGFFTQKMLEMRFERRRFSGTMMSLLLALEARDGYTSKHSDETLDMAMLVADQMELDEAARMELKDVALLHDIGKIGVPDEILNKPGALNEHEWEVMRRHPAIGEQIVAQVPGFESVSRAIRHEHERWDGTGYPDGISGEQIPLASRIVLVCDAFHAMTSDRPYRKALSESAARNELVDCAGTQFDPSVVGALLSALNHRDEPDGTLPRPVLVRAA